MEAAEVVVEEVKEAEEAEEAEEVAEVVTERLLCQRVTQ